MTVDKEPGQNNVEIHVNCWCCGKTQPPIIIKHYQLGDWNRGMLVQNAFPQLTASERELLISGTCDNCFHEMFGGGE